MGSNSSLDLRRIDRRIKELDRLIPDLEAERRGLLRLKDELMVEDVMKPGEKLNLRTRNKLLTLAQVVSYLNKVRDQAEYDAEIKNTVFRENGSTRRVVPRIGASSAEIWEALQQRSNDINYGTLRSYLTRAKNDGLLDNDESRGGWYVDQHKQKELPNL